LEKVVKETEGYRITEGKGWSDYLEATNHTAHFASGIPA
jgi:hypothetical protein